MEKYRCFRDHLNEVEVGLAYILATYKNKNKDFISVTLLDEVTLDERTVLLPHTVTVQELKRQARALWSYDEMVEDDDDHDNVVQVFAPSSSSLINSHEKSPWPLQRISNDKAWAQLRQEWALGAAVRRDASLLQYCREACRAVKLNGPRHGAPEVLFAARRLANLIALSANQVALDRLGAWKLVDSAVIDLLESHASTSVERDLTAIDSEGAAAITHAIKRGDGGVSTEKKVRAGSSSPWIVAAGARLHWGLAHSNARYKQLQACCGADGSDAPTTLPLLRALQWACDALRRRREKHEATAAPVPTATTAGAVPSPSSAPKYDEINSDGALLPEALVALESIDPPVEACTATDEAQKEAATEDDWLLPCSAEALDAMVFLCLGSLWSNLRCPTTRKRHSTLALACAVELAVHEGASEESIAAAAAASKGKEDEESKGSRSTNRHMASGIAARATAAASTTTAAAAADVASAPSAGAQSEVPEPRTVRWLASHLACFLLVHESELRSGVASSGERVVGGLAALLWHRVVAKRSRNDSGGGCGSGVDIGSSGVSAGNKQRQHHKTTSRGLSPQRSPSRSYSPNRTDRRRSPGRVTATADGHTTSSTGAATPNNSSGALSGVPEALSLCGVTILASLVSTAADRARMTKSAAEAALAPTMAFAEQLSTEVRRSDGNRKHVSGPYQSADGEGTRSDRSRGFDGSISHSSKGASTPLEHALVAVWGLLLVLRRVPESAGPNATEENEVAAANAAARRGNGVGYQGSNGHDAKQVTTITPQAANCALAALLKKGMDFAPPVHMCQEALSGVNLNASKCPISKTAHRPTNSNGRSVTNVKASGTNTTPSTAPTVRRRGNILLVPSTALYDERSLLDRVLRLCAWHRSRRKEPAWAKRHTPALPPNSGERIESRRNGALSDDAILDDSTESDEDEDSQSRDIITPAYAYDPVEDEDDFGESDGEDLPGDDAANGGARDGATGRGDGKSDERSNTATPSQRSATTITRVQKSGSTPGAKGVLSEVEVRCSVACLSILAGIAPAEMVRRLGCRGVARLLALAEDGGAKPCGQSQLNPTLPLATHPLNPPGAASSSIPDTQPINARFITASSCSEVAVYSTRVQESAIAALAHLTKAAIVPANLTQTSKVEVAAKEATAKKNASYSRAGAEVLAVVTKEARRTTALEAQFMLGCVVHGVRFIERLARLRASAEVKALSMPTVAAGDKSQNADRQQRKRKHILGVAKAASLSIMHLTALITDSNQTKDTTRAGPPTAQATAVDNKATSSPAPVKDEEGKTMNRPSSKRLFKAMAKTVIRFAPPPREMDLIQPIGQHLFPPSRLALVAEGLWSRNRAVAAQACASLWCLARDSPTRAALVELSLAASRKSNDHQKQGHSNRHCFQPEELPHEGAASGGLQDEIERESSEFDGPPAPLRFKVKNCL